MQAFVSEYAVWKTDAGRGTLLAALAEAAFLTGLEKNRWHIIYLNLHYFFFIVKLRWSFVGSLPFANVFFFAWQWCCWDGLSCSTIRKRWYREKVSINGFCFHWCFLLFLLIWYSVIVFGRKKNRWNPDVIVFNTWQHYGTPSYWMQKLFRESSGAMVHPTTISSGSSADSLVASAITWKDSENNDSFLRVKASNFFPAWILICIWRTTICTHTRSSCADCKLWIWCY